MASSKLKNAAKAVLKILISGIALYVVFTNIDWEQTRDVLLTAHADGLAWLSETRGQREPLLWTRVVWRVLMADRELGLGNSIHVTAYRISSLVPGSLALVLADAFTERVPISTGRPAALSSRARSAMPAHLSSMVA